MAAIAINACFDAILDVLGELQVSGVPYRCVPHWCNGKSLEGGGLTREREVVLCLGLVEDCRTHMSQRDI